MFDGAAIMPGWLLRKFEYSSRGPDSTAATDERGRLGRAAISCTERLTRRLLAGRCALSPPEANSVTTWRRKPLKFDAGQNGPLICEL